MRLPHYSQYPFRPPGMDNDIFNNGDNYAAAGNEKLYRDKRHLARHQQPLSTPQPQQQNSKRTRTNTDEKTSSPNSQTHLKTKTKIEGRSKTQQLARGELFSWLVHQITSLLEYGVKALKYRFPGEKHPTKFSATSGSEPSSSHLRSLTPLPNGRAVSTDALLEKSFETSVSSSESEHDAGSSNSVSSSTSSGPTRSQNRPFRKVSSTSSVNANNMPTKQDTPTVFTSIKSWILSVLSHIEQHFSLPSFATEKSGKHACPKPRRKTLVLDLDETLIHSTPRGGRGYDFSVEVSVEGHACLYYVYKRPHVDLFLQKVQEWYNVVIFTASMAEYADPVIDRLDQTGELVNGRLFRNACTMRNGSYVKDLAPIEPDLRDICLIDNSPVSYVLNPANAIPIEGWISDKSDEALLDLIPFLDALRFTDDVRSILSLRLL